MNFDLPPLGGIANAAPEPRQAGRGKAADFSRSLAAAVKVDAIPAAPPPDVLEQMIGASRVAEKLRAQSRELHFEPTREGRVIVQVRDLDGNVIRTIAPGHAVDVATGAQLR